MFETWHQIRGLLAKQDFREKIASIITHRVEMGKIHEGFDLIKNKKAAKVVLEPKW
jgi:threonine dehydrogenase-like Zn-dependent dehydrogenase